MKKAMILLAAPLLLACTAARPQEPAQQSNQPRTGGTLAARINTDLFDFDTTYVGQSTPNTWGISLAYNTLMDVKAAPDVGFAEVKIEPELAERWEMSPDAKTFTFHLRKGVKYAPSTGSGNEIKGLNGRVLTSADVKWSFEYISRTGALKDKKLPKSQGDWMFTGLQAIETPDPYTVSVRYDVPFAPFASYAASKRLNPIYPKEIFEQEGGFKNRMAGSGPFQYDEAASQKGTRWVFKKNPAYFEPGRPYLDEVRLLVIRDDATTYAAFQTGQVDHIGPNIPVQAAENLKKSTPNAVPYPFLEPGPLQLFWNVQRAPTSDFRVRRAIALTIDRDEFVPGVARGQGGWGISGATAGIFSQEELRQIEKPDLVEAKRLLADAGYANGLTIEFNYPGSDYGEVFQTGMQLLEAQLKRAGITLALRAQDKEAFSASKKTGEYTMNLTPNANLEGDIGDWVFSLYHGESRQNNNHVNDPVLTARLEALQGIVDQDKRKEEVRAIARYIYDKAWGLAIYHGTDHYFWQPYVKNYAPNFWRRGIRVTDTWLDK